VTVELLGAHAFQQCHAIYAPFYRPGAGFSRSSAASPDGGHPEAGGLPSLGHSTASSSSGNGATAQHIGSHAATVSSTWGDTLCSTLQSVTRQCA
jgi:hypothetical protein